MKINEMYPDMKALMNVCTEEDDDVHADHQQIAAISQLLADRTEDENSPSKLSTNAFVDIANKMGLSLTPQTLIDLAEKGELADVIKDVNLEEIQFKGQGEIDPSAMTVDKAKATVSRMAKRNAKKAMK